MTTRTDAVARVQPSTIPVASPLAPPAGRRRAVTARLRTWGPVVLWMVVIFVLSARSGLESGDGGKLRFDLAKLAHLAVYLVLGALLDRAFTGLRVRRQVWWVMVFLVLYAITDEIHQAFVPGRTPLMLDVAIDAGGGLLGIAAWRTLVTPRLTGRRGPSGPVSAGRAAGSGTGRARR
jgi:VanZ family protein